MGAHQIGSAMWLKRRLKGVQTKEAQPNKNEIREQNKQKERNFIPVHLVIQYVKQLD